jgi:Zn finger protein HypA/HybF involved in hydrogenase expression
MMKMENKEYIWVCPNCGSREIEIRAWVQMNAKTLDSPYPMWVEAQGNPEDYWCPECEDHYEAISLAEYEKQKTEEDES